MIKTILVSALLYCASTQDAQSVLNQAGDVANQAGVSAPSTQDVQSLLNQVAANAAPYADSVYRNNLGGSVVVTLGEYEWVLTENGEDEVGLSVVNVPGNANNVDASIAGILGAAGAAIQNNVDTINQAGTAQAQDLGVAFTSDNAVGQAAQQYGEQLQSNSGDLSPALADAYNQAGAQLVANQDGVTDQVNQQINNALANGVNVQDAQNTAGQILNNFPADTVQNLNDAANQAGAQAQDAAATLASNIDPNQSAAALENVANTNVDSVANSLNSAANSALSQAANAVSGLPTSVDTTSAVNNAADSATTVVSNNPDVTNAVNNAVNNAVAGNLRGGQ